MKALVFDKSKLSWEDSRGFEKVEVLDPIINEQQNPSDANYIIIKVMYAGVCGSDRGIWNRTAFGDQILKSLEKEKNDVRIIGHEFFGEIITVGSNVGSLKIGDKVAFESHLICKKCFQCKNKQENVCSNQLILGISHNGGFAEFAKIPAYVAWKTDINKIRPEIAVLQEPFGNAVHAASKVNIKDKSVVIFGLGPIGFFLLLILKHLGAKIIIGVEVNEKAIKIAKDLGIDHIVKIKKSIDSKDYSYNKEVVKKIIEITGGLGEDVAFEMAGANNSLNNCIKSVRRGGDVVLFGLKNANFIIEDFTEIVMKGITLHSVAGRQVWKTWEMTKNILENNNIQDKLWNIVLEGGNETIVDFKDYNKDLFEKKMAEHTKILLKF